MMAPISELVLSENEGLWSCIFSEANFNFRVFRHLSSPEWNADIFYSPKLGQRWVALANKQTGFKKIMRFSAEVSLLSIEGLLETEFSVTERKRPLH